MNPIAMIKLGGILLILATVAAGYFYVTNLQNQLMDAKKEIVKLEIVNEENQNYIEKLEASIGRNKIINKALRNAFDKAERAPEVLVETYDGHDLEKMARRKPEWLGKIFTDGTKKFYDDFSEMTDPKSFDKRLIAEEKEKEENKDGG